MDQIQDLSAFQGVILSADNFYSFAKLKSKGGNEEKVKYVVEKLFNFLKEKNYITENGVVKEKYEEYQKLALYLVLNADLPVLEEMTETEGLEAVIWTLPTLPAHLLTELFWGLHMEPFLHQIIAFCEPRLALQVADAFIANMKYLDPVRHAGRVAAAARALHRLACRLPFARQGAALRPPALRALRAALDHLAAPPRAHAVLALPRDQQYRYVGHSLERMLHLVEDCLRRFTSVQRFEADDFADIYLATHHPESIATKTLDYRLCDSPDDAFLEFMHKCNAFLLDDCTTLVMSVSVDIFCAWSEHEEGGRTMQQSIGELCHRAGALLRSVPSVADHALLGMLEQISRKPLNVEDVIDDTAVETIVERVRARDADSAAWLAALPQRAGLCRQPALLRLLDDNMPELAEEQAEELFDAIAHHLRSDRSNEEYLKVLAIKAFQRCGGDVQEKIVDDQFREHLHDDLQCAEFEGMLTDAFNRLTAASGAGARDVLPVFVQNPQRTFVRIFCAAAEGERQADVMLGVMERLRPHCGRYYRRAAEPCLVAAAAAALDAAARGEALARFLAELKRRGALPANRLLVQVLMPRLPAALRARDARALAAAARLLLRALAPPELAAARGPLLAAAARALDAARAAPADYTPDAPDALDLFLQLKDRLFDTYEDEIPDKELVWLRDKLSGAAPLTRAHYARLYPAGAAPPAIKDIVRQNNLTVLSLSRGEWGALLPPGAGGGELRAAGAALRRGARAERARRAPASAACLQHAHAALAAAIKNNYFSQPPTDEQVLAVVGELEALAGEAAGAGAEGEAELVAAAWLPLLAHVAAARPALAPALAARLAAAPLLARPFAQAPPH